jgi:hypothetical protein
MHHIALLANVLFVSLLLWKGFHMPGIVLDEAVKALDCIKARYMRAWRFYMIIITTKWCCKWMYFYTNQKQWQIIGCLNRLSKNAVNYFVPTVIIFTVTIITYNSNIIIIIFHHEFKLGWPVSVSAFTSSSSLFSGRPGHRFPFGW